jgi:hypothetical protein
VTLVGGQTETGHHQLHLLINLNHRIDLSDGLIQALRLNPGAQLVNTTGLDLSREIGVAGSNEVKLVQKFSLNATWSLGQSGFVVGHPEVELGYMLYGPAKGEFSIAVSGTAGLGSEESLGKLVVTVGRKPTPPLLQMIDGMHADVTRWKDRLDFTQGELVKATTAADSAKLRGYIADYNSWIAEAQDRIETFEGLNTTRAVRERQAKQQPHCLRAGWYCTFRLSLGNLSLVDLIALIRNP